MCWHAQHRSAQTTPNTWSGGVRCVCVCVCVSVLYADRGMPYVRTRVHVGRFVRLSDDGTSFGVDHCRRHWHVHKVPFLRSLPFFCFLPSCAWYYGRHVKDCSFRSTTPRTARCLLTVCTFKFLAKFFYCDRSTACYSLVYRYQHAERAYFSPKFVRSDGKFSFTVSSAPWRTTVIVERWRHNNVGEFSGSCHICDRSRFCYKH